MNILNPGPAPYDLDAYGDPAWVVVIAYILILLTPFVALIGALI